MNKTLKIILVVLGVLVAGAILITGGFFLGRINRAVSINRSNNFGALPFAGRGMMGNLDRNFGGMMGRFSRLDRFQNYDRNFSGMMRRAGRQGGMMGGWFNSNAEPLTIEQATNAVQDYLDDLDNPDLKIGEVMIFDNNTYARIVEASTGTGAFELLVDNATQQVYPEPGPNHMWNLKYNEAVCSGRGAQAGQGVTNPDEIPAMTVTEAQALEYAQAYLDDEFSGSVTADEAEPFYGYYTIDILKDGKITGMLSVNGYTGQVFYHHWHGEFIEMSEAE